MDGVSIRLVMHEGQLYFVRFADDGVTLEGAQLVMDTIPAGDEGDATNASIERAISLAGITPAIYYANESAMLSSFVNQFNASSATTNSVESGSAIVDYSIITRGPNCCQKVVVLDYCPTTDPGRIFRFPRFVVH